MLYSKNGSIPYDHTDGTDGWIEVPEPPVAPAGKEVVWWFPPGWVIRDPKPEDIDGHVWKWSQSQEQWVCYETHHNPVPPEPTPSAGTTADIYFGSADAEITLNLGSAIGI